MSNPSRVVADFLAAVGDPTRVELVRHLAEGDTTVGGLATAAGVDTVKTSHHLGVLRAAGMVDVRVAGRTRVYRLVARTLTTDRLTVRGPHGIEIGMPRRAETSRGK